MGACLKQESRVKFEASLRKNCQKRIPPASLFEHYYDMEGSRDFKKWGNLMQEYIPPADGKFSKILVPTEDTTKF